jgi:hypothetical protein
MGSPACLRTDDIKDKIRMIFNRNKLQIRSLNERNHGIDISLVRNLEKAEAYPEEMAQIARKIIEARAMGSAVIMMIGGHVIRSGVQKYIIDLMERGYLTCLATNGAGVIHDYELSLIGATTENVSRYLQEGQFGLWEETGRINDIVNMAYQTGGLGLGEAIGKAIQEGAYPHKEISLFAACYRMGITASVHVGIGYDIINEHPNYDGAAAGATSYRDFLKFAGVVSTLEHGVVMNFGSAVMAPEVFLKALSMARNVARQKGETIQHFTTLVCDLYDLPKHVQTEPAKENVFYYFRPWKTMLARSVADGGDSCYIKGRHADTIPALWTAIQNRVSG